MNATSGRLLTFEVAGHLYGLPIEGVLEVSERAQHCGVPTLPRARVSVANWHGEALPLVAPRPLVEGVDAPDDPEPFARAQVLVISDRSGERPTLGLPIDGVLGLIDGPQRLPAPPGDDAIVERRQVDGRVVGIVDPRRLVDRARQVIGSIAD